MKVTATGVDTNLQEGIVHFTIRTAGVVKPEEQTYTVTLTYLPDDAYTDHTLTTEVTGLSGSIEVPDLKTGDTTPMELKASIENAPTFGSYNLDTATGTANIEASTLTSVTTKKAYLVGNIEGVSWSAELAVEGENYYDQWPYSEQAKNIFVWNGIKFNSTGEKRLRFINMRGTWAEVNAYGMQYYPTGMTSATDTQLCNNFWDEGYPMYDYSTIDGNVESAWGPNTADVQRGEAADDYYTVFLNLDVKKMAIAWNTSTPTGMVDRQTMKEEMRPVDVYNLQGVRVRTAMAPPFATLGLPQGVYIVGGKKVAVN